MCLGAFQEDDHGSPETISLVNWVDDLQVLVAAKAAFTSQAASITASLLDALQYYCAMQLPSRTRAVKAARNSASKSGKWHLFGIWNDAPKPTLLRKLMATNMV